MTAQRKDVSFYGAGHAPTLVLSVWTHRLSTSNLFTSPGVPHTMISRLTEVARTHDTDTLAEAWDVDARGVYDRLEGYKEWSVRDAAAVALLSRRPLSLFV